MKCSGWGFEEVDAGRIVLVSPDGEVLAGDGPRHIEYPIHTEIMAARPDVGAVVHTHSASANAFSALDGPLLPLDHAGSLFCYPEIPRFTQTGGLIKNRSLGAALAATLGDAVACLLPQHGIVTVGADMPAAIMTAVLLDRACRTQLTAMAAGPVRRWGDEEDTVAKRADVWSAKQCWPDTSTCSGKRARPQRGLWASPVYPAAGSWCQKPPLRLMLLPFAWPGAVSPM